jgi:hypothetical protein
LANHEIVGILLPRRVVPFALYHTIDMASLGSLPIDIVLDNLLPCLRIKDVVSLFSVNKAFVDFSKLETFWIRRLKDDFRIPNLPDRTRFDSRFLYSRLYNPKIFVWGWAPLCLIPNTDNSLVSTNKVASEYRLHPRPAGEQRAQSSYGLESSRFWPKEFHI